MSPTIRFWWARTSEHDSYIANRDTPGEAPNFSHQGPLRIGSSGWISMGRATAYGATLSLPRVPAKVPSPKPQRPFVLGSGYRALCGRAARITLFLRREPSWRRRSLAAELWRAAQRSRVVSWHARGARFLSALARVGGCPENVRDPPRTGSSVEQARPSSGGADDAVSRLALR